jgi:hypothetical protein
MNAANELEQLFDKDIQEIDEEIARVDAARRDG